MNPLKIRFRIDQILFFFTLFSYGVTFPLYAIKAFYKTDGSDFDVYYLAATRAIQGNWSQIYTLEDQFTPFRYAPLTLSFFMPFGHLPLPWSRVVWCIFFQGLPMLLSLVVLYRLAQKYFPERAKIAISLSALLFLRFQISNYQWGQVAALLLLGFTLSLLGLERASSSFFGGSALIGTLLKVGPGMTYLYAWFQDRTRALKSTLWSVLYLVILTLLHLIWIPFSELMTLFKNWRYIVSMDRAYVDPSKYGSQSFLSFFVRLAKNGWISYDLAETLGRGLSIVFVCFILGFWLRRKALSFLGEVLSFSLVCYTFCFVMPQTYRYTYVILILPVFALLLTPLTRYGKWALGLSIFFLALSGKDFLAGPYYFTMQELSLPLFSILLLFFANLGASLTHTVPRR